MITLERRLEFFDLIRPFVGKGMSPSHPREMRVEVARFLTPNDPIEVALASLGTMSNCTMTQCGFLRLCGVDHPALRAPYFGPGGRGVIRNATEDIQEIAKDLGAWRDPKKDEALWLPCDLPIIGGSGYEIHGFIVRTHSTLDARVGSVEGGKKNHGAEIAEDTRRLGYDHADRRYWTWEGPGLDVRGRPLFGWVDFGALLEGAGVT